MAMGMKKGRDVHYLLEMETTKQKKDQIGCCLTVRQDSGMCLLVGWRTKLQTANLPPDQTKRGTDRNRASSQDDQGPFVWRVAVEG